MLATDEESVSKILSVLSHKIRREILLILNQKGETSFTDLMKALNIDTGKLSFHIRALSIFIEQSESGKYRLNKSGEDAVRVIIDVQSWAEFATMDRRTTQLPVASFRRRTYAFLIDYGIMLLFSVTLLLPTLISVVHNWFITSFDVLTATLVILWGYSAILEGFSGQTVGKRALGISVIRIDGRKIDYEHTAVRNFGKVLLPFDLYFGYRLKDPRYIRYFDKFAGTSVIELRKRTYAEPETAKPEEEKPESAKSESAEVS